MCKPGRVYRRRTRNEAPQANGRHQRQHRGHVIACLPQEGGGERSAAPTEKTIARLMPLGCVSTPMGTGKSNRPQCARSQVQFIVRGQLRRNSRMMERSRQRRRQRNANEALRRVRNIERAHAGASMTIMRYVGRRISPDSTDPVLGLRKLNFGASNNNALPGHAGIDAMIAGVQARFPGFALKRAPRRSTATTAAPASRGRSARRPDPPSSRASTSARSARTAGWRASSASSTRCSARAKRERWRAAGPAATRRLGYKPLEGPGARAEQNGHECGGERHHWRGAPPACLVLLQPVVGLSENPPTILPSCAVCTTSTSPRR